jgi:hypothetical protein
MQFGNEVLFVEYTLNEGDNAEEAMKAAREFVWDNHKRNNQHLYQDQETKVTDIVNAIVDKKQRPKEQIAGMIYDIRLISELTVLKSYELLCKNNPLLKEVYQSKLKELTNE